MTQQDKELLLKDLCARLPYGVFVKDEVNDVAVYTTIYHPHIDSCQPYLRPMSSMTEEEKQAWVFPQFNMVITGLKEHILDNEYRPNISADTYSIDYLNAHHFDYRNLIEKGLALEAPEGMYNN